MCGGAILAELIPSPRRAASKPVTAGHLWPAGSDSKKAGSGRNKRLQLADVDDFEAAFEDFADDFDEEEVEDHHFKFSSKSAFSPGNRSTSWLIRFEGSIICDRQNVHARSWV
jgi:EREBP-like factor